jgi:hypothetical protein
MKRHHAWILVLMLAQPATRVLAQASPGIGYVYPAGGTRGATLEVNIGGQRLRRVKRVHVSGTGIKAEIVKYIEPSWRTFGRLRRERDKILAEVEERKKKGLKVDHIKIPPRPRRYRDPKEQPNAQIEDTVRVRLDISKGTAPGPVELRLADARGVSNPLVFHVGTLNEILETPRPEPGPPSRRKEREPTRIRTLPCVVNGQVFPGETDRFLLRARKGQRLVFMTQARDLIPYLADAVPGWFQAVITLHDKNGRELAFVDDYRFMPDPVLVYDVPATGEYELRIRDAIYRGRQDFVYRIAIGELPFATGLFPLGGRSGKTTTARVSGVNLKSRSVKLATGKHPTGTFETAVRKGNIVSNPLRYAIDDVREVLERSAATGPQSVTLPCVVNGRIDQPGDWDVFSFRGRKGDTIVAEVRARRLNSPLDSIVRITDSSGKTVAHNDDHVDRGAGLITHHADSYVRCSLPRSGTYRVHIGDVQNRGSEHHAYRLRIGPQPPDFELRVVPSSVTIPRGGSAPVTVHVLRRHGFDGDVALSLKDGNGVLSMTAVIPGNTNHVPATVTATGNARPGPVKPVIVGRAKINGKAVHREAVPAEDMMQAFLWRFLVPTREWVVNVRYPDRVVMIPELARNRRLKIPDGGSAKLTLRLQIRGKKPKGAMKLVLENPPQGVSMEPLTVKGGNQKVRLVINGDGEPTVGDRGNLIITGLAEKGNHVICMAPAIPFEIIE